MSNTFMGLGSVFGALIKFLPEWLKKIFFKQRSDVEILEITNNYVKERQFAKALEELNSLNQRDFTSDPAIQGIVSLSLGDVYRSIGKDEDTKLAKESLLTAVKTGLEAQDYQVVVAAKAALAQVEKALGNEPESQRYSEEAKKEFTYLAEVEQWPELKARLDDFQIPVQYLLFLSGCPDPDCPNPPPHRKSGFQQKCKRCIPRRQFFSTTKVLEKANDYIQAGQLSEAKKELESLDSKDFFNDPAMQGIVSLSLGDVYRSFGKAEENKLAQESLQKAIKVALEAKDFPVVVGAKAALAQVETALGNEQEAKRYLEEAKEEFNNLAEANQWEELKARLGDFKIPVTFLIFLSICPDGTCQVWPQRRSGFQRLCRFCVPNR